MTTYPAQTRYVARACEQLGLRFRDLDQGGGYLFSVSNGRDEFASGSGAICTWPLNGAAAFSISRDKHHTNAVLQAADLPIIPGELFFLHSYMAKLREPGRERADAIATFARMDHPVFCKPNQGSRGDFAEIVSDLDAFRDYIERVAARYDAILLQPVLDGAEYRIFCLDGEAVFSTRKADFAITGDGERPLSRLLYDRDDDFTGTGVSPLDVKGVLAAARLRHGIGGDHVLAHGEKLILPGRRNLSAGGDVADFTTNVSLPLASLALKATKALGLRVAGIDIFDLSERRDLSELVIIEVNGNPGIQSLETIGRDDLIDTIWQAVLTRYFAECRS
jgi:glutathione synthase/RimK-type ligase-like ATP-grasp enzyme